MREWLAGPALYEHMREVSGPRVLLGFSRGKDSIGAALALREHFDEVVPFYMTKLPGISMVKESLAYYERHLFKRKIHVVPHPAFFKMLQGSVFQDYNGFHIISQIPFPRWTFEDVRRYICKLEGLSDATFTTTGVRSADSLARWTAMSRHGPITVSRHTFHPIWDWKKARLLEEITKSGLKLPVDYLIWGRTFDGIGARFMIPLRDNFPDDYKIACAWFPHIPTDILRWERMRAEQAREAA